MKIKYIKLFYLLIILILITITISYIWESKFQYNGIFDKSHFDEIPGDIEFPKHREVIEIPQNIYRIWFGPEKKENQEKGKSIKKLLPDYKIIEIKSYKEAENFILTHYNKQVFDIFNLISKDYPACKSDLLRLLILYAKGGIYLDCKSNIKKDISYELKKYKGKLLVFNWFNFPFFSPFWTKSSIYGEFCNWGFASNKGNIVLREIIKHVLYNIKKSFQNKEKYTNGFPYILSLTGPHIFTHKILNTKNKDKVQILGAKFNGKFLYSEFKHDKDKTHWKKNNSQLFV